MELPFKHQYKTMICEMTALGVYNVGAQKCLPLHQWGPGVRNHYLIHYIVSGRGVYTVGEHTHHLHAGQAFLVLPDTEITYYADETDPWEYVWVGFAGTDAQTILQCTAFSEQNLVICPEDGEAFRKAILRIYAARGSDFNHAVCMTGELYCALSLLMLHNLSHHEDIASQYVQKAATYIAHHYAYPISIMDIASYVGIDRSHLYTVFKQVLGVSPKDYLTDFRIRKACALLREPALSVTAVANSVGFENNLYFSKVFRKHMGLTPSDYRRKAGPSKPTSELLDEFDTM